MVAAKWPIGWSTLAVAATGTVSGDSFCDRSEWLLTASISCLSAKQQWLLLSQ